jgi:hypothetical protein
VTSAPTETRPFHPAGLGTLVVLAWSGEVPDGDMPYLLAYPLGDGPDGPEGSTTAVEEVLEAAGLTAGGELVDGNAEPGLPVTLLVEDGEAVVRMPGFSAQCTPPQQWLEAAAERGFAYLVFTTRPWPEAEPGKPVEPEALSAFVGAEATLKCAAHVLLPVDSEQE